MSTTLNICGLALRPIFPSTTLSGHNNYVVIGTPKDNDGDPRVATTGNWIDCDDYAERNDSPDNYESYRVYEVIA